MTKKQHGIALPGRKYPSKLLLLGEYSVLSGTSALAVPFDRFCAEWSTTNDDNGVIQRDILKRFTDYLLEKFDSTGLAFIDTMKMQLAFDAGARLESDIPGGCGLGSSGAFCAAVLDAFGKEVQNDLLLLHRQFILMESFFHGKSSGLDPMVSYLEKPLIIAGERIKPLNLAVVPEEPAFGVFLLDSEKARETAPLVKIYREKLENSVFRNLFNEKYFPLVNSAISAYCESRHTELWQLLKSISQQQLVLFREMIPDNVFEIWKKGVETEQYFMKLCGAGGGGYFYLFTEQSAAREIRKNSFSIERHFFGFPTDEQESGW